MHTHYLRGTIFCGRCGKRLIFSRNVGRHGGTYDYFICPKRHGDDVHCSQKAVRVERVEDGISDLYGRFSLPAPSVRSIRLGVQAELAADNAEVHAQAERANRVMEKLGRERTSLMQAHYAGAVPIDLLKTEMTRLTRAMADAERQVEVSSKQLAEVEDVLEQALAVAANCHVPYDAAPGYVKRQINQGFFEKLWIAQDGTVERYALTEPFAALLETGSGGLTAAQGVGRGSNQVQEGLEAGEAGLGGHDNTPTSVGGRGVNETGLVELRVSGFRTYA